MVKLSAKEAGLSSAEKRGSCPCSRDTLTASSTAVANKRAVARSKRGRREGGDASHLYHLQHTCINGRRVCFAMA